MVIRMLIIINFITCQITQVLLKSVNFEGIGVKAFCEYGVNFIVFSFVFIFTRTQSKASHATLTLRSLRQSAHASLMLLVLSELYTHSKQSFSCYANALYSGIINQKGFILAFQINAWCKRCLTQWEARPISPKVPPKSRP